MESQSLNTQDCEQVASLMERKYAAFLDSKNFDATSTATDDVVAVKVTLRDSSGTFVYPVEGRIHHLAQELEVKEAAFILFDFIDSYFEEYLKHEGGVYLPIDWADYQLGGVHLQLKGQVVNEQLERMADEWLAGKGAEELH